MSAIQTKEQICLFLSCFKCLPAEAGRVQLPSVLTIVSHVVMLTAACLSSPLHQQTSHQMMGHLCLADATGIAGPFLTHLLITPWGHRRSQSRQSCLSDRGSLVWWWVRYEGAAVVLQIWPQKKNWDVSFILETHVDEACLTLLMRFFVWGQCVYNYTSSGSVSVRLMQMRSF